MCIGSGVGAGAAAAAMAAALFHNNKKCIIIIGSHVSIQLFAAIVNDMQVVFKSIARASSS